MPYREFSDSDGVLWQAWETRPGDTANVRAPFAAGWLTFESQAGRVRLRPIPDRWSEAADEQLAGWLQQAHRSPDRPRSRPARAAASETREQDPPLLTPPVAQTGNLEPDTDGAPHSGDGVKELVPEDRSASILESEAALLARSRAAVARAREIIRTIAGTVRGE